MSTIDIRPVRTGRDRRAFLTFPWRIYRNDPLWVPPTVSPSVCPCVMPTLMPWLAPLDALAPSPAESDWLVVSTWDAPCPSVTLLALLRDAPACSAVSLHGSGLHNQPNWCG